MAQRVAVIEGEDASPEAVRPTVALIDALGLEPGIEWVYPPVGQLGIEYLIEAATGIRIREFRGRRRFKGTAV